ncbi:helix-turn-helix domain-containing protein [Herbiconiux daphne]|uniref:helix-turn-helix domain-containing protein n=1 Tax=Herbiconiux daphne TaxID=2970914 RepID=UPI0038B2DD2B
MVDLAVLVDLIRQRIDVSSANGTTYDSEGRLVSTGETVTVPVAAARLGCSPRTLTKAIGEHRLEARKLGRDWLIRLADLDSYRFGDRRND